MKSDSLYFLWSCSFVQHKAILTFELTYEILMCDNSHTATKRDFPVVLLCCTRWFYLSVDQQMKSSSLKCDHIQMKATDP